MQSLNTNSYQNRLGFHYDPDAQYYRIEDLHTWLPRLKALGAGWLVLPALIERAIPEAFIRGFLDAGINPILQLRLPLQKPPSYPDLELLFQLYARWGVRWLVLYDRPNLRQAWPPAVWTQADPVEQTLDRFIPLAERAAHAGLNPVFPALVPGGDYWDLAFLKASLQSLRRRGKTALLENLVFGVEANAGNQPLDWGAGGPERWPQSRPYVTPPGSQDQRGFRTFDWYQAVIEAELGERRPLLLLRAGAHLGDRRDPNLPEVDHAVHAERNLHLAKLALSTGSKYSHAGSGLPPEVLACNFWLLCAQASSPNARQAWFQADGTTLPVVESLSQAASGRATSAKSLPSDPDHPILHYLLLPATEPGLGDWHLERLLPFIRHDRPTVGFSMQEARLARRVTVAGGSTIFAPEALSFLQESGCLVERILPDGTIIASEWIA